MKEREMQVTNAVYKQTDMTHIYIIMSLQICSKSLYEALTPNLTFQIQLRFFKYQYDFSNTTLIFQI